MRDSRGFLWFCTEGGLSRYDGYSLTNYGVEQGLPDNQVRALLETRKGEYFVGAFSGLCRFNPRGRPSATNQRNTQPAANVERSSPDDPMFALYHTNDNSWAGSGNALLEDHTGAVWCGAGRGLYRLEPTDGDWTLRFVDIGLPREVDNDMIVRALAEDGQGALWIGAGSGLYRRWPDGRTERYTTEHGLPANNVLALLIDGEADGLPLRTPAPLAFREDRMGNIWIGFVDTDALARFSEGRFTLFTSEQGLPRGAIGDLYLDHAGRLWIASTAGGLACLDDPSAKQPRFITYTTAQGLSSNSINCITEDRFGRLYAGTARGVDQLDPATDRVKPFTAADGLISGEVLVSFRDRKGDLWFGGKGGLSRLSPQPDPPQLPPPILITGLRIGGEVQEISALGETEIASVELGPDKNQIQIDFLALGFSPGEVLR